MSKKHEIIDLSLTILVIVGFITLTYFASTTFKFWIILFFLIFGFLLLMALLLIFVGVAEIGINIYCQISDSLNRKHIENNIESKLYEMFKDDQKLLGETILLNLGFKTFSQQDIIEKLKDQGMIEVDQLDFSTNALLDNTYRLSKTEKRKIILNKIMK